MIKKIKWCGDKVNEERIINIMEKKSIEERKGKKVPLMEEEVVNEMVNVVEFGEEDEISMCPDRSTKIEVPEDVKLNSVKKYEDMAKKMIEENILLVNNIPGVARKYEHTLEVDESRPFKIKSYPIPRSMQKRRQHVERWYY
ncbi:hypothetical protein QE152_g30860 [Popillia japonica]|uniref:Uncharacterized protein n=1 Tax=Popillia japonica TaxID=7064 RepID=A0AAW1JEE3_POPJA